MFLKFENLAKLWNGGNWFNTHSRQRGFPNVLKLYNQSDVTCASWRFNSTAIWLFVRPCIWTDIKWNIQRSRYYPLWGESTGDNPPVTGGFHSQRVSNTEGVTKTWRLNGAWKISTCYEKFKPDIAPSRCYGKELLPLSEPGLWRHNECWHRWVLYCWPEYFCSTIRCAVLWQYCENHAYTNISR